MTYIKIIREKCIGCEQCVAACPFGQIQIVSNVAVISDGCTLCGSCVEACGCEAIRMERDETSASDVSSHTGVWVFAEQSDGQIRNVVFELLGETRRLATIRGMLVTAILVGEELALASQQLIHYGADQVLVIEAPALRQYNDQLYADVLAQLIRLHRPEIVLIGATSYGRSLAPRVASRLETGLTADCTGLSIDENTRLLLQTRPAFGGNLMATIICPNRRPQMATVRPRVMKALDPDFHRVGKVIAAKVRMPDKLRTRVLSTRKASADSINLADAEIIVAVGKGIGGPAGLTLCTELAQALGGVIGATRPVVDAGWVDYSHQIGQTGRTVAPKLYIACGISGAVQHLAGMSSAETIVAINQDPNAPIFAVAHFCIVGDALEVVPALLGELRRRR